MRMMEREPAALRAARPTAPIMYSLDSIANRVGRVEAKAVEMKFLDPITSVGDEKFANWS